MRMQLAGRSLLPRRTVRLRLAVLYGGLFLLSAAVLLAIANGVGSRSVSVTQAVAGDGVVPRQPVHESQAHAAVTHQFLVGSVIALGVMALVSAVLGWVIAGRVLRPLREMTAATRRISADSLHERLAMPGPGDELKDLADTIDGLLERLEGAFAAQRRFIANASHELRTPLATMRASLDVAVAKPAPVAPQTIALAGRVRTELDQVDRLLEGFLVLARAQHGVQPGAQPGALPGHATLMLEDVVAAALAARATAIAARNLTAAHTSGRGVRVRGSETLLRRMVDNVLDNAIGHNRDEGWIRVTTGVDGPVARLVVETGGQLLDQQQVAQLAQPFRRLGADRTGSDSGAGLGLSIVAAIAAAHGGTLDLRARAEGGLRVSIGLPLAVQAAPAGVPA